MAGRTAFILYCILVLSLLLAGCSTGATEIPDPIPDSVITGLPPLPTDRAPSEVLDLVQYGYDAYLASPNSSVLGDLLLLHPEAGKLAWTMWQLQAGDDPAVSVSCDLETIEGNGVWLAISDYVAEGWVLHGPYTDDFTAAVDAIRNESQFGNIFIAVIKDGEDQGWIRSVSLQVERSGWQVVAVATDGDIGNSCRITEIDGRPAIACGEEVALQDWRLNYFIADDALGLTADDWTRVNFSDQYAIRISLANVNGQPAISFAGPAPDNDLLYTYSLSPDGSSLLAWQGPVVADSTGEPGDAGSLAVVDGKPAITYYDFSNKALRFAWSSTKFGAATEDWDSKLIDATTDDVGLFSSLNIVDGNPAASYINSETGSVIFLRSTTPSGSGVADWIQTALVDDTANVAGPTRLVNAGGNPAVIYRDDNLKDLKLTRSTSLTGEDTGDWAQPGVIDNDANTDVESFSAAVVDGNPAVAYVDDKNDRVIYSRSKNSTGIGLGPFLGWPKEEIHRESGHRYLFMDMAVVDGRPALCWYDQTAGDLYYAVLLAE